MKFQVAGIVASVPLVVGCLADPPTYEAKQQIPPAIVESQVAPPLDAIVELQSGQSMAFTAPFFSEDLGEAVEARIHVDVKPGEQLGASEFAEVIPPSTYDDDTRSVSGSILPDDLGEPGCHSVTLIAAHRSQFAANREPDETKVDRITWWVHLPGTSGREVLLKDCVTGRENGQ